MARSREQWGRRASCIIMLNEGYVVVGKKKARSGEDTLAAGFVHFFLCEAAGKLLHSSSLSFGVGIISLRAVEGNQMETEV